MTRRLAVAVAVAVAASVASAAPASAHTVGGVTATNFLSEITAITPPAPAIDVRLLDLGRRLQLTNRAPEDVVVLGYSGEPYLRVGPAGVFENRRSPTLYQNRARTGNSALVKLPPEADAGAPPEWRRRSGARTVTWPDHRARWEGPEPPSVRARPGQEQVVVTRWSVPLRRGAAEEPIIVSGRIAWVPGPGTVPYFLAMAALLAAGVAAGATRWWTGALSGALALLLASDMVRLWGDLAQGGDTDLREVIKAVVVGLVEVAALGGGAWAVGAIQRGRPAGVYVAMASGVTIAFMSGFGDLLNLAYSQVPSALPPTAARAAAAVCLGLGLGIVGGSLLALRRLAGPATRPPRWARR